MKNEYTYPIRALINLNSFRDNIKIVRMIYPNAKIILPVKANAYGHGDLIISKEAEKIGIEYLATARINEGIRLRENNIKLPIINLGAELDNNIDLAIKNNIELSVSSITNIIEIEKKAKHSDKIIALHLKIDTGMRRLGCNVDNSLDLAKYIDLSSNLKLKSIYTHFAKSDNDNNYTKEQSDLFYKQLDIFKKNNISYDFYHLCNSGGIINLKEVEFDNNFAIRPGIMIYGYSPSSKSSNYELKPVMTLVSKVIHLKKVPKDSGVSYSHTYVTKKSAILATIPLGYGDGFPRILSNKFSVKINGKSYKQVGTISMDLSVIEVDKNVKIGDDVYIFGDKNKCINDANDLAKLSDTISYEITTALNNRVIRIAVKK